MQKFQQRVSSRLLQQKVWSALHFLNFIGSELPDFNYLITLELPHFNYLITLELPHYLHFYPALEQSCVIPMKFCLFVFFRGRIFCPGTLRRQKKS